MRALKTRRSRVAAAPVASNLQIDVDGDWRRILPGVVGVRGAELGDLCSKRLQGPVRLASTATMAQVKGCECNVFNQSRVLMELELEVRVGHQNRPVIEMVEVD